MQHLKQDIKALGVFFLLMALLFPTVKKAAQKRAERIALAHAGSDIVDDYGQLVSLTGAPVDPTEAVEALEPLPERPTQPRSNKAKDEPAELLFPVMNHDREDIISVFGDDRGARRHAGVDIQAPKGTPVVAVTDGFIERISNSGLGGKQVWLRAGNGRMYFYGHLDKWIVQEMQVVEAGDVLGYVGETGNASTPHLHFEIHVGKRQAVDPLPELFPEPRP